MSRPLDLATLRVGDRIQDPLLVWDVEERSYAGGAFTVLTLVNSSGRIETAPFFDADRAKVDGIRKRHVVQVIGEVDDYNGRRQLRVGSLRLLPEASVDLQALLPSVGDVTRYWETLDGWRREVRKPRLARVLSLFYDQDDFRRRYGGCPASVSGHHAALGGLVKHTVEVGAIARTIARVCGADPDLVLAGVLLHDIGKLEAYRWDGVFELSDAGHLLGHVALGALLLDRRLAEQPEPPCTAAERDLLHHLILSHHGLLEYGSPVRPMTLEAEVLHWADNASAKTGSMADALREAAAFGDGLVSQRRFWQLDNRRAFRGVSDWGLEPKGEGV
jgi:3'-5' exoribonuclease